MKTRMPLLALALSLGIACTAQAQATEPSSTQAAGAAATGTLIVYDTNNRGCTLNVPAGASGLSWQYEFKVDSSPCASMNNAVVRLIVAGLPSATRILMTDDELCRTKSDTGTDLGDFWLELKTTAQNVSTEDLQLTLFWTYQPNEIVRRGLQLVNRYVRGSNENVENKLSCVRITTSGAPYTVPAPPITLTRGGWQRVPTEYDSKFKCPAGELLVGRLHYGSDVHPTEYRCATPMQAGKSVTIGESQLSLSQGERSSYMVCPLNMVMTGREHDGDDKGRNRHWCAELIDADGQVVQVEPQAWSVDFTESGHNFECPGEQALIGRRHEGDQNGDTWYRCGKLIGQAKPQ